MNSPKRRFVFFSKKNPYFPLTKRMSRSFERRWAKEAARTFLEWVLLGSMFILHTVEFFNFCGGWQFKHKAGLNPSIYFVQLIEQAILQIPNSNFPNLRCCSYCRVGFFFVCVKILLAFFDVFWSEFKTFILPIFANKVSK